MPVWIEVEITGRVDATSAISVFELKTPSGDPLPAFSAGAHIDVKISDDLVRQYSLCNDPAERDRYMIAVLNDPSSRGGSRTLHESFLKGKRIVIGEPRNHFPLDGTEHHVVLVAGGIGVTPILAMARQLKREGRSFEIHYCARSRVSAAFLDVLAEDTFAGAVHLHFDDERAVGGALNPLEVFSRDKIEVYVCGPTGFMEWIIASAENWGVASDSIHREFFSPVQHSDTSNGSFEVQLASTGQIFVVPPDKSIVRVLDEAGVEVLVSCEQGVCGSCITEVLEGEPEHRDSVLTESEKRSNTIMTPCCSRAKSKRLVLNL